MNPIAETEWSNWSGFVTAQPRTLAKPQNQDELSALIKTAPGPIRLAGSGHSFTPLVKSEGTILSLDNFQGLKSHDPQKLQATVGAGTQIGAMTRLLHDIGQALPNMGDIDKQAFGGALGTSTHGSGITLGAYPTQLEAMEITDGRGAVREFNRAANPDAISAMGASLGAFGAVTQVTIRNIASYRLHRRRWCEPVADVLDRFQSVMTAQRSVEFFYIPFSGHAMMLTSDITDAPATSRPPNSDDEAVNTLRTLRNFLKRLPWLRGRLIGWAIARLPPEDYVEAWLNVYATERNVKFNEMEYHLPLEEGAKALREIIALLETRFPEVYFPIEVRVVAPDEIWLSPFYKRPSCSIAIHHGAPEDPLPFFNAAEPIFRRYGGRPHWGKMHNLTAKELSALYPRWKEAMEVRRDMDPDNRFVSPYLARLLGVDL
ncbi:D-arabinono-1,4-lactone oxidase [Methylocapsa sp. S129]|uniref:D-arabinono-1,4-lactone oxidase n=1 Tax=Methylocapsa sp. S129 TaxID=1641869 RepID=UPI003529D504